MGQYTVEGLKALGYRGYIREKTGEVREDASALARVAFIANFNRYHLIFEVDRNERRKRIRVRDGIYTMNEDAWIEKELI